MSSAAETLCEHARDEQERVSDLLSRAINFAAILRQKPVTNWLKQELGGFAPEADLPCYRQHLHGTLVAWMPGQGWIEAPVSNEMRAEVSEFELREGIRELERAYERNRRSGGQRLDLPEARVQELRAKTQLDTRLNMAVPNDAIGQILESVRLVVGMWAQSLVDAGLTKEPSQFTAEDRQSAEALSAKLTEYMEQASEQAVERMAAMKTKQGGFFSRMFGRA
ncbi:hypothetical protein H0Z60_18640 [Ectothiorhodospiraceae bacterium WFHF3C12]|nr:hypothetical protein [Ectothiorhodospiraceae bacterium WFHF3C12]